VSLFARQAALLDIEPSALVITWLAAEGQRACCPFSKKKKTPSVRTALTSQRVTARFLQLFFLLLSFVFSILALFGNKKEDKREKGKGREGGDHQHPHLSLCYRILLSTTGRSRPCRPCRSVDRSAVVMMAQLCSTVTAAATTMPLLLRLLLLAAALSSVVGVNAE